MRFFVIANILLENHFYDFDIDDWQIGLSETCMLPSKQFAENIKSEYCIDDGKAIEVLIFELVGGENGNINAQMEKVW